MNAATREVVALATLQLSWGGLFDSRSHDDIMHLVRMTPTSGTPGATLCGIDRFAKGGPGFSVGGGVSRPGGEPWPPCTGCVGVADRDYPGLPVWGGMSDSFDRPDAPWNTRELAGAGVLEDATDTTSQVAIHFVDHKEGI